MTVLNQVSSLHQVLIIDGLGLPSRLPRKIIENRDHALSLYPHASYKLWSGEELRSFIGAELGKEVLQAFDTLTPYSYKCDLARYALLYARGGLYFDLAVRLLNTWDIPAHCGAAAFTEMYPGMESWTATQTSLLWSQPKRPEWQKAIESIVENCKQKYYGPHDHYPTAGALLGRSFAAALAAKGQSFEADDQWIGECRYITPERQPQNLCYVAPDRKIVGLRTKLAAGDLGEMGLTGTNNYTQIYRCRQVYGETVRRWSFKDPRIVADAPARKTATGLAGPPGSAGRICYGPFVDLSAGSYTVVLEFSPKTTFSRVQLSISAWYAKQLILDSDKDYTLHPSSQELAFEFSLDKWAEAVEFRVSVLPDFVGELVSISLKPTPVKRAWAASDAAIETGVEKRDGGIVVPKGHTGRVSWGPYARVPPGTYVLGVQFSEATRCKTFQIDICHEGGTETAATHVHGTETVRPLQSIEFPFSVDAEIQDLEFRSEVFGDFEGRIMRFSLAAQSADGMIEQPNLLRD